MILLPSRSKTYAKSEILKVSTERHLIVLRPAVVNVSDRVRHEAGREAGRE